MMRVLQRLALAATTLLATVLVASQLPVDTEAGAPRSVRVDITYAETFEPPPEGLFEQHLRGWAQESGRGLLLWDMRYRDWDSLPDEIYQSLVDQFGNPEQQFAQLWMRYTVSCVNLNTPGVAVVAAQVVGTGTTDEALGGFPQFFLGEWFVFRFTDGGPGNAADAVRVGSNDLGEPGLGSFDRDRAHAICVAGPDAVPEPGEDAPEFEFESWDEINAIGNLESLLLSGDIVVN